MKYIPYSRQDINEDDIKSVVEILRSDFLTTGPAIKQFEESVKDFCGAANAVAVANGTAALHVSLMAMGIEKSCLVWTSPLSFVASANCALYVGADVDFVDIDIKTGNIDVNKLEEKLKEAEKHGKIPDVVIVVHFSGKACDMQRVSELAAEYDFKVIEDAAHALGGRYESGEHIGCGKYSDATTLSFHPVKSIATGEGGMILTDDEKLAKKANMLITHGVTRDKSLMKGQSDGDWYYQQLHLGYNYRITDIQSALGISQMNRLDDFIHRRYRIAAVYNDQLSTLPLILPILDSKSAWHLYVVRISDDSDISRKELFDKLRKAGIGVNVHYIPIYQQPYYRKLGFKSGYCPMAEKFYQSCVSLPVFPKMTDTEQEYIVDKLKDFLY